MKVLQSADKTSKRRKIQDDTTSLSFFFFSYSLSRTREFPTMHLNSILSSNHLCLLNYLSAPHLQLMTHVYVYVSKAQAVRTVTSLWHHQGRDALNLNLWRFQDSKTSLLAVWMCVWAQGSSTDPVISAGVWWVSVCVTRHTHTPWQPNTASLHLCVCVSHLQHLIQWGW